MICLIKTVMCMVGVHDWETHTHFEDYGRARRRKCMVCGETQLKQLPTYTFRRERRRAMAHARREAA